MAWFKCNYCGNKFEVKRDVVVGHCQHCGSREVAPLTDFENIQNLFNLANTYQFNLNFIEAEECYSKIIEIDSMQADAYWGVVLAKYGVVYNADPNNPTKNIPVCKRGRNVSIYDDDDYKSAVSKGDAVQRQLYQEQAAEIERNRTAKNDRNDSFSNDNSNVEALVKRAYMFLEDGDMYRAYDFSEKILNQDAENAEAYLIKLLIDLGLNSFDQLAEYHTSFENNSNYKRVLKYAGEELTEKLTAASLACVENIKKQQEAEKERYEQGRRQNVYDTAMIYMSSSTVDGYNKAIELFKSVIDFKDSNERIDECNKLIDELKKNTVYNNACYYMASHSIENIDQAIKLFDSISTWKDSQKKIEECNKIIENIKVKMEEERLERERLEELKQLERKKRAKLAKIIVIIASVLVCLIAGFVVVLNTVIIPNGMYDDAIALMNNGEYYAAIEAFEELDGYKDSAEKIKECTNLILDEQYEKAIVLMNNGNYAEAIEMFENLDGHNDSEQKIAECNTFITEEKYQSAISLMNSGKYKEAIEAFKNLGGYKDSAKYILECEDLIIDAKYKEAISLMNSNEIIKAYEAFVALGNYKDSSNYAAKLYNSYKLELIKTADVGSHIYFGTYEQDNNLSNGAEEIEWIVIAKEGDKLLIVSKNILCYQPYSEWIEDTTWSSSYVRTWLNNTFYNNAFSSNDKSFILNTIRKYKVGEIQDVVFLLDYVEFGYLKSGDKVATPTKYATSQKPAGYSENWMLRTDSSTKYPPDVSKNGQYREFGNKVDTYAGVRPAMWIDVNS